MKSFISTVLLVAAGICRLSRAEEPKPDPAALLADARALFADSAHDAERQDTSYHFGLVECLYGDRERGRKELHKALAEAKSRKEYEERRGIYGPVLEAQRIAGLNDDVRETIRIAAADQKSVASDKLPGFIDFSMYELRAIEFYGSIGATDEGLGFIEAIRFDNKNAASVPLLKVQYRLKLVDALIRNKRKPAAEELLQATLREFPVTQTNPSLAALWFRLGDKTRSQAALESLEKDQTQQDVPYELYNGIAELGIAAAEGGDRARAEALIAKLESLETKRKKRAADAVAKISARLGEFEKAAASTRTYHAPEDGSTNLLDDLSLKYDLLELGMRAYRAGRQDLADKYFGEVTEMSARSEREKLKDASPADKKRLEDLAEAQAKMTALEVAQYRLAGGDLKALFRFAEQEKEPGFRCIADLLTAIELNAEKTGLGRRLIHMMIYDD